MKLKAKLKKMWNSNKLTMLFASVILIIVLIMLILVYPLYASKHGSQYGNRLDGIKNVKITDSETNNVKNLFEETDKVKDVKTHLSGKIYNILITLNDEQSYEEIMELSDSIFEKFSEKQMKYYDFQIFIKSNINGEEKYVIGYKNSDSENIFWTNNKTEED